MNLNEPEVKELGKMKVAYVSFVGNYIGNTALFEELFGKIISWAASKNLLGKGALISTYQDDLKVTPPEELTLEVCIEVPEGTVADDIVQVKVLPGGKYLVMHSELTKPVEYRDAWGFLDGWMKEKGFEFDLDKPCMEVCLNNPLEHPEGHHIVDICASIK